MTFLTLNWKVGRRRALELFYRMAMVQAWERCDLDFLLKIFFSHSTYGRASVSNETKMRTWKLKKYLNFIHAELIFMPCSCKKRTKNRNFILKNYSMFNFPNSKNRILYILSPDHKKRKKSLNKETPEKFVKIQRLCNV